MLTEIHFESVNSTSDYAKENAVLLPLPALITADGQTAGRGRRGHSFFSPENTGLYMTLVFEANESFGLITPAAAVCLCEAIKEICGVETEIKWVNDIFLSGKKIGGILTERYERSGRCYTAVGIGLNLTTKSFPPEIGEAASLGKSVDKCALARSVSEKLLKMNESPDNDHILNEYRKKLFVLGKEISYETGGKEKHGIAESINESCNLIVSSDGKKIILSSGEISIKMR